jgi:DNA transposition AAA+ family ATPase
MAMADIRMPQFAQLVGYATTGIVAVLNGTYTANGRTDLLIREALESAMDRHPIGDLTKASAGRMYETENVKQMRDIFTFCHKYQALAVVYGPPGSQKTFVLEQLVAEFNQRELGDESTRNLAFLVRASIGIRPRDLVAKICREVGAYSGATLQGCMSGLRQRLRGTKTVIVLDEAQLCGIDSLEALRELHDTDPKLGIVLAGSHQLKKFFDGRASELEQWNSRLHAVTELSGVSDACARAILAAECPELSADDIDEWIADAKVADKYSRDRNKKYLSVRRLFNSIATLHRLTAEAEGAQA